MNSNYTAPQQFPVGEAEAGSPKNSLPRDEVETKLAGLSAEFHSFPVLDVSIAENGGLRVRSGEQRFYEGVVGFRFPMFFSGVADVCEWYDDDAGCFRIRVHVENEWWGPLFGYTVSFQVERRDVGNGGVPAGIPPRQLERRE